MVDHSSQHRSYADRYFEQSADPICIVGFDGRLVEVNPAFERLTARSATELSGMSFPDLMESEDGSDLGRELQRLSDEAEPREIICAFRGRENEIRRVAWSLVPDRESDVVLASGRDVTDLVSDRVAPRGTRNTPERDVPFFFARVLDSLEDCVYAWNRQEQFVYANRTVEELWGLTPEQYYGKTSRELGYPPQLYELFSEQIAQVFETGEAIYGEIPYTSPTDLFGYFEYIFTPMLGHDGNVDLVTGVSRNTTRRRTVEEALRSSEERLRLAIEAAHMYSFEIDLHNRSFTWSENAGNVVDFPMPRTLAEALDVPHPDDRDAVVRAFSRAVDHGDQFGIEYRVGSRAEDDELWLYSVGVAIEDDNGDPTLVVGITQNITERKRAERAIREDQERQAFLLSLSDHIRQLNDPRAIMNAAAEALGRKLNVSQVGYAEVEDDQETFIAGGEYSDGRMPELGGYRGLFADHGPTIGMDLRAGRDSYSEDNRGPDSSRPESTDAARAIGVVSGAAIPLIKGDQLNGFLYAIHPEPRKWPRRDRRLLREVAERTWGAVERARAEAEREHSRHEAERAVRVRDMFLSIASHELRNPMASIKASAQLLARYFEQNQHAGDRERTLVNTLIDGSDRLASLVEDLLDVSRLQSGQLRVQMQPTDLAELVRATVADQREALNRHPIRLDVQEVPTSRVDPERIRQVLVNLLENAAKYSDDGAEILVSLRRDGAGLRLSVKDRGIGLPVDALESIFEPFGRASNATESNIPGMGLGLYICRRLAETHGGKLWAESRGGGAGSTMCLWLPLEGGEPT